MRCPEFEKRLLRSLDNRLSPEEYDLLKSHLTECPSCRARDGEYRALLGLLRVAEIPESLSNFWERLAPRLEDRTPGFLPILGFQHAMKAVSAVLAVLVLAAGLLLLISGNTPEQMSSSEILLLRNENPFLDTRTLLEEKKVENKGMMLIFASSEEPESSRRKLP